MLVDRSSEFLLAKTTFEIGFSRKLPFSILWRTFLTFHAFVQESLSIFYIQNRSYIQFLSPLHLGTDCWKLLVRRLFPVSEHSQPETAWDV